MTQIKVVAFDADDTLWINEPHFQAAENKFCELLSHLMPQHSISRELLSVERSNIALYGYGVKAFMLSMIETAIKVTNGAIKARDIERIIGIGRDMLQQSNEMIDGVEEVLQDLQGKYRLVMATKGDLLDQERKLRRSGLAPFFHHTEIVSEKNPAEYARIVKHLDIKPEEFVMVGNSLKSDILPILEIGGYGFHVPFHTTWELEKVEIEVNDPKFRLLQSVRDVPAALASL